MKNKKEFYALHSELCKTLSNPKRQEILDALRKKEMTVNELVESTGIAQSNLSQHLAVLRTKGIVSTRRERIYVYYSICNPKIIQAFDLISEVLRESLASQNKTVHDGLRLK